MELPAEIDQPNRQDYESAHDPYRHTIWLFRVFSVPGYGHIGCLQADIGAFLMQYITTLLFLDALLSKKSP